VNKAGRSQPSTSAAVALWARTVVRRHLAATVVLGVLAGLAGGAAMSAWEYSRRAGSATDRLLAATAPAAGTLLGCPPGVDRSSGENAFEQCFTSESTLALFDALRTAPAVAAADFNTSLLAVLSVPGRATSQPTSITVRDATAGGFIGRQRLLRGRLADPRAADEAVISERAVRLLGVDVGSSLQVAPCAITADPSSGCGTASAVRVTGVIRDLRDLKPAGTVVDDPRLAPGAGDLADAVTLTPAWRQQVAADTLTFATLGFIPRPGRTLDDVRAELAVALPGWFVHVNPNSTLSASDAVRDATAIQARALLAVGALIALAAAVFVGQTVSRQVRRELVDREAMRALGLDRADAIRTSLVRSVPVALIAACTAVVVAVVASAFGPGGFSDRVEVDPGIRVDPLVLLVGAGATAAVVAVAAAMGGLVERPLRPPARSAPWPSVARLLAALSVPAAAGLRVAGRRRGGANWLAIAAVAAAVSAIGAAAVFVHSLERVETTPVRYGAAWQFAANFSSPDKVAATVASVRADPLIAAAATLNSTEPLDLPGIGRSWMMSVDPLKGEYRLPVVAGRVPTADDEVALGPATMRDLGVHIGDVVPAMSLPPQGGAAGDAPTTIGPFRVVGEVLLNDGDLWVGPGRGLLLTHAAHLAIDSGATGGDVVVTAVPGVPRERLIADLFARFGALVVPQPQVDLARYHLISAMPWLLAAVTVLLAVAAFAHALVVSVRGARRQYAVLRALGFSRGQVWRAVSWRAFADVLPGIAVGVPVGIAVGRWLWHLVAARIGLVSGPVVTPNVSLLVVAATLVIGLAIAAIPGMQAGRMALADALRSE
jgi:hypothetical protein